MPLDVSGRMCQALHQTGNMDGFGRASLPAEGKEACDDVNEA